MKLLFDENLSPKLVANLNDLFPDSKHVDRLGLGGESDNTVWEYAKANDSVLYGHPPKVIWIRRGNCSNRQIQLLLRNKVEAIKAFNNDRELSFMQML